MAEPARKPLSAANGASVTPHDFAWFAAGVGSWFGAWGLQMVVFSWLLVGELHADAEWVGIAQTSTMLPALLLVLLGGAAADRFDPRRLLIWLHLLAPIPVLLLAAALWAGRLSIAGVIGYGLVIGTVSAFCMPARDALLSRVAGGDLMRAVTAMTAVQFGAQSLGNLLGGSARWAGVEPLLWLQAALLALGALTLRGVPAAAASHPLEVDRPSALREILQGLQIVAHTEALRAPLMLVLAVGLFFMGPFLVAIPLAIRDHYGGGPGAISLVFMLFPLGTIAGSLVLRVRGVRRKGLASLLALAFGSLALTAMGLGLPLPLLMAVTVCWGIAGSVFINCSRTLYQEAAPVAHRARVLSVYQLCFLGGAPLGSVAAGLASANFGPLAAFPIFAAGMAFGAVIPVWLFTRMAKLE